MRLVVSCILVCAAAAVLRAAPAAAPAPDDAGLQFFENKVRPLLVETCYKCHSTQAKKLKGNLYLDSLQGMLKGGDSGPAVVAHQPEHSKLIEAIGWGNVDLQMPPKAKLTDGQIADLTAWVKMGAPWPASAGANPVANIRVFDLQKRKASHWCWEPIGNPTPPAVKDAAWARSPIDRFILAKLESQGLTPAPSAERPILIRRVYFDLIGLPPTPAQVEAFVADPSPEAFEKVVDSLLASDHFGERWARHWMDLARYAETRGHEFDYLIPNAWQYRDYLIRAFNADVPYNQLVTEQVAGDLLKKPRLNPKEGFDESILGTAFWLLGEGMHSPVDIRQDEADRLNNCVDTFTKAFLGLTVGCARCHDHKFDAISQKDFYALNGFLLSTSCRQVRFKSILHNRDIAAALDGLRGQARAALTSQVVEAERPTLGRLADYLVACASIKSAGGSPSDIDEIASRRSLDSRLLAAWKNELARARTDVAHPLHAFALFSHESAFRAFVDLARQQRETASHATVPDQVILDFSARSPAAFWDSDGAAFGVRPVAAGELVLGQTAEHPILGVMQWAAARRDPCFNDLRLAPGTEPDHGALGQWDRCGQTFRTRKVTLKTGNLWYLVRGAGHAYAAVDSHRLIGGPLHGALLHSWKAAKNDQWVWVRQNLTEYAGERCEIEFSPASAGVFEIAKVIEADRPPALDKPGALLAAAIGDSPVDSVQSLAAVYQKLFASAADRLVAGGIAGAGDSQEHAALADWLVRRADLFCPGGALPLPVAEKARQFIAAQSALAAQISVQSPTALAMYDGNGVDENVLLRGAAKNVGDLVPRRFLEAIAGDHQKPYSAGSSGRLQLAAAMLDDGNPFTSRVEVNRVWQHLFGRGIVPTVDNFGVLGQPPTHRELLDYLASHFRTDQNWSIKKLIRSIVLSSSYQMSSKASPEDIERDPQNLAFSHMMVRRLEAEAIRDEMLAVSGRLDPRVGGPPVAVYLTPFMNGRGKPGERGPLDGDGRRSIYTRVRRNFLPPMMLAFDAPTPFACIGRRNVSNVPAQALILMNDPFVVDQAGLWAKNVLATPGQSPQQRIADMYLAALNRPPRPQETADLMKFLDEQGAAYGLGPDQRLTDVRPWKDLCHVMFNLKEFIFLE